MPTLCIVHTLRDTRHTIAVVTNVKMEAVLIILTFGSFLTLWVTVAIFYTPSCHNLREMIDSVNQNGELTRTKSKWMWYGRTAKTLDDWIIHLPTKEKYLKYEEVQRVVYRIGMCRKVMSYTALIMIISGMILLMIVY